MSGGKNFGLKSCVRITVPLTSLLDRAKDVGGIEAKEGCAPEGCGAIEVPRAKADGKWGVRGRNKWGIMGI